MQRLVYLLFIMLIACLSVGCEQNIPIQASGKTVKIGFIGPFTGVDGVQGRESIKGIRTMLHLQPLLHNGDAIELVIENDHNDPELTERALRKLSERDKVSAVLLASSTTAALKAAKIVDTIKIPTIALLATHPGVVEKRKYINQLCFDDRFQGSVAALFVADELLIEKVAVFTELDDMYSVFLGAEFVRKYESVGGEITQTIVIDKEQNDFSKILHSLHEKGTELLYFPVSTDHAMEIIKAARKSWQEPEMMGSDGLLASVINNYPDDLKLLEGIYASDFFSSFYHSPPTAFGNKVAKIYHSLFHGFPSSYTALGAEGYAVLYAAMDRCNDSADRECINRMIRDTNKFEGIMARISIGADGKAVRPLFINRISNGKLKTMVKVH